MLRKLHKHFFLHYLGRNLSVKNKVTVVSKAKFRECEKLGQGSMGNSAKVASEYKFRLKRNTVMVPYFILFMVVLIKGNKVTRTPKTFTLSVQIVQTIRVLVISNIKLYIVLRRQQQQCVGKRSVWLLNTDSKYTNIFLFLRTNSF